MKTLTLLEYFEEQPEIFEERELWLNFSTLNFAMAYGEGEPEYTLKMIKEPNPDYVVE